MKLYLPVVSCSLATAALLAGCATTPGAPAAPPTLALATGQKATTVLGEPDFSSYAGGASASLMSGPVGSPALANGILYVPDENNNRVLGYLGGIPSSNGASADFALGQPDLAANGSGAGDTGLHLPEDVRASGGKLFVADWGNNRLLIWNTLPTSNQAPANVVVGQPDFTTTTGVCQADTLNNPEGAFVYGDKLIVGDTGNNRVLIYNAIPTSNGASADLVLGQSTLTTCAADDDAQTGTSTSTPTSRTLRGPIGVWTDGTRLVVADEGNARVLIWNTFPTHSFQPADVVVGQPDMTSANSATVTGSAMNGPYYVVSNGTQLFASDSGNHRVLVWDAFPTQNGTPATLVLGQQDFTSSAAIFPPTVDSLANPSGLLLTDTELLVSDTSDSRVVVFKP